MVNLDAYKYIFLFGRLFVFVLIIALLIVFAIVLIKAAKKRRERNAEAIHQLFNPDDNKDSGVNINIDPSNDTANNDNRDY